MNPSEIFNSARSRMRPWTATARRWLKKFQGWEWIGLILLGVMIVSLLPTVLALFFYSLTLMVILALAFFWVSEFARLMRTTELDFPGRHDRWIWILVMIILLPLGAAAFWTFRHSHWADQNRFNPVGKPQSS